VTNEHRAHRKMITSISTHCHELHRLWLLGERDGD
jgi:hypothetical protein